MNMGQISQGAISRRSAFAIAGEPQTAPADRAEALGGVSARIRLVEPATDAERARARIRDQVLADRGMDQVDFTRLPAQDRLVAFAWIEAETDRRLSQARKAAEQGRLVDLKV
jgi:hypothetical protein